MQEEPVGAAGKGARAAPWGQGNQWTENAHPLVKTDAIPQTDSVILRRGRYGFQTAC